MVNFVFVQQILPKHFEKCPALFNPKHFQPRLKFVDNDKNIVAQLVHNNIVIPLPFFNAKTSFDFVGRDKITH